VVSPKLWRNPKQRAASLRYAAKRSAAYGVAHNREKQRQHLRPIEQQHLSRQSGKRNTGGAMVMKPTTKGREGKRGNDAA